MFEYWKDDNPVCQVIPARRLLSNFRIMTPIARKRHSKGLRLDYDQHGGRVVFFKITNLRKHSWLHLMILVHKAGEVTLYDRWTLFRTIASFLASARVLRRSSEHWWWLQWRW